MSEVTDDLKSVLEIRELSEQELIRAIRVGIKAEVDAIHLYDMIAESTSNEKVSKVMKDVAKEERVHIGEFLRVLQEVFPQEMQDYNEGASEAEEHFNGGESAESEEEYPTEGKELKKGLMDRISQLDEKLKE